MNKVLLVIVVSIAIPLLVSLTSDVQLYPFQVLAQSNSDNSTTPSNNGTNLSNWVKPGETIAYRGIVSSEALTHTTLADGGGEIPQRATVLPHREDGALYTGVLTFTATKPVDIGFAHRLSIDNETLSQIDKHEFGELFVGYHNSKQGGIPGAIIVPSVIEPDYGTEPPYYSASVPFVGSSVWLRTPHAEPFVAVYEVVAEIIQPENTVDLESANVTAQ
jgi:hypothetical protein